MSDKDAGNASTKLTFEEAMTKVEEKFSDRTLALGRMMERQLEQHDTVREARSQDHESS